MNYKLFSAFMFAAGAAIGSAVTWKVLKTKYDKIVQEEIDSVRTVFTETMGELRESQGEYETEDSDEERPRQTEGQINWDELEDLDDEESEANEDEYLEYRRLTNYYKGGGANDMAENVAKEPYVISPHDFGEKDGYHTVSLTYYEDDVLEDEGYIIVTDRDELLGPKALFTFGEYEDDSVFVRNERLRTDFEILKDPRTYEQARSTSNRDGDD